MRIAGLTILLVCCSIFSIGQTPKFSIGHLDTNIYINDFFGFSLKIDTSWRIINKKDLLVALEKRINSSLTEKDIKYTEPPGIHLLLSLTSQPEDNMPEFLVSSLDLSLFPQLKDETGYLEDYIKDVKKSYKSQGLEISASKIIKENIANTPFYTTVITIKSFGFLAYQKRYSKNISGRLINIMVNYESDEFFKKAVTLLGQLNWN